MKAGRGHLTFLFFGVLFLSLHPLLFAQQDSQINIHFFWGDGCPHCQKVKDSGVLDEISKMENVHFREYEIYLDQANLNTFSDISNKLGISPLEQNVPLVVIETSENMSYFLGDNAIISNLGRKEAIDEIAKGNLPISQAISVITIPFMGELNLSSLSLPLVTVLIAFVDGINPCSLWVLTFLLGIVIHTGSRKKTIIVGLTFLLITASAYGAFMLGLLSIMRFVQYMTWVRIVVALIATTFAVVNIKDYFWYKKGLSFTISDKNKPKIYENIRNIMKGQNSIWAMILATAIMALGIVLVELPCTAGFPVIWTGIVAKHNLQMSEFAALFFLYLVVYLLDELLVFGAVAITLKVSRFEEKQGRTLKLIGGMIMLALAVCLMFLPEIMNSIGGVLIVFGIAIIVSLLTMMIHRKLQQETDAAIGTKNILPDTEKKSG
jgi:thiol-disulfide isomerase/thioredoxin